MTIGKTPNGRWRARVKSGRHVIASKTFDYKRDAEAWAASQKRALSLGEFVDPKAGREPLGTAVDRWMESRRGTVASTTFKSDMWRKEHLRPLRKRPISAIRAADLDDLFGELLRGGLSYQSVVRVRALLGSFFTWAKRQGLVSANVVPATRVPRGTGLATDDEVYPFTIDELRDVQTALARRSKPMAEVALVLGLTGLRWGELAALRARDVVAVPMPALRVSRSQSDGHGVKTTKAGRARTVPLLAELVPVITSWAHGKDPDDLLFTTESGHPLNNSNWRRAVGWSSSCRGRRIHDLRHTAATFWLSSGIDVKTVQAWLGHASAQLTLNLYGHYMGSTADSAAVARLNSLLGGTPGGREAKAENGE